VDLNLKIWNGKRVLITGHTGFKGSWLTVMLRELGAEIIGVSLSPTNDKSLYIDGKISEIVTKDFFYDVRDYENVSSVISSQNPDYVFHLAAQSLVLNSLNDPLESFSTNIIGTANVLLAALRKESVQGITIATTDKVYKNLGWVWPYRENDQLGGDDPYSASKAASEIIVKSLNESNNLRKIPVTTVRAGNVIGGGDWADHRLIPDLVRAHKNSEKLKVRNLNSTRPWQYILDCLWGYLLVGQAHLEKRDSVPEAVNFGPKSATEVASVIQLFMNFFECDIEIAPENSKNSEQNRLDLDSHLAKDYFSWETSLDLHETVRRTAFWYKSFLEGENALVLMVNEINDFISKK
jgi:CDP-glucose 4,6-dehydratase